MASTPPTRVDDEVYADAAAAGEVLDRSVAKQLSHWARIGREVEASAVMTAQRRRIEAVLAGQGSYDELTGDEQAFVRASWSERIAELAARADVGADKHAAGLPYVTLNADGDVVKVHPDGTRQKV